MVGRAPITGHLGPGICEKGSTFVASKPERSESAALVLLAVMAFIAGRPTAAAAKSQWKRQAPELGTATSCNKFEPGLFNDWIMHVSKWRRSFLPFLSGDLPYTSLHDLPFNGSPRLTGHCSLLKVRSPLQTTPVALSWCASAQHLATTTKLATNETRARIK